VTYIETHEMKHCTIQSIYSEWDSIVKDPHYQRNGDLWTLEKKQLLVDSIINRYDIPKLYFHRYDRQQSRKTGKTYAVIDGRQRLETIVEFVDGKFPLGDEFQYLEDASVDAAGMSYQDLAKNYPKIKSRFDSFSLPIMLVDTDDLDLIEEMFSRLNEAVPLSAPEKRRAIGGDMVKAIDEIARHSFFTQKVRFPNKRYQHKEGAVRLLFLAHHLQQQRVVDTKKPFLDEFTREYRSGKTTYVRGLTKKVDALLDGLAPVFNDRDPLLASQASVPIYAFVFLAMEKKDKAQSFTRTRIYKFEQDRRSNKRIAETNLAKAKFELLEYDKLSLQGTNDASSIRDRWRILGHWLGGFNVLEELRVD
jgi:hypothetical protein